MEQAEYEREAIDWSYITFDDNQDVLDLIERRPQGIISILDDQCVVPKANADTLAESLYKAFERNTTNDPTDRFSKPKRSRTDFSVRHYAGTVTYSVEAFLDKNKDYTIEDHLRLLRGAGNAFIADLFAPTAEEQREQQQQQGQGQQGRASRTNKFSSAGSNFRRDLQALMVTIDATEPNYVRCIKPNDANRPALFQEPNVLHQLRCGGVLEAVRISCAGFPSRRLYADFVDRFGLLLPRGDNSDRGNGTDADDDADSATRAAAARILEAVAHKGLAGYQLGRSKVFLRAGQMALLDKLRTDVLTAAARRVQAQLRRFLAQRRYDRLRCAALTVQAASRGWQARRLAAALREEAAAVVLQAAARGLLCRRRYVRWRAALTRLQARWRGIRARRLAAVWRRERAATTVQAVWRGHRVAAQYRRERQASVVVQCAFRRRRARAEFRRLKAEAKDLGKVLGAKAALEQRLEELQWRLELEKRRRVDAEEAHAQALQLRDAEAQADAVAAERRHAQAAGELRDALTAKEEELREQSAARSRVEEECDVLRRLAEEKTALTVQVADQEVQLRDLRKRFESQAAQLQEQTALAARLPPLEQETQRLEEENFLLKNQLAEQRQLAQQLLQQQQQAGTMTTPPQTPPSPTHSQASANGVVAPAPRASPPHAAAHAAPRFAAAELVTQARVGGHGYHAAGAGGGGGGAVSSLAWRQHQLQQAQAAAAAAMPGASLTVAANYEELLAVLSMKLGFYEGLPLVAHVTYHCLLAWRCFEADRTNIFDRIIHTVQLQLERENECNEACAYWLANTATLLLLLQQTLRTSGGSEGMKRQRRTWFASFKVTASVRAWAGTAFSVGQSVAVYREGWEDRCLMDPAEAPLGPLRTVAYYSNSF
eukprot:scaffold165_cov265-Prasinococcus_capsulatus_cf.AAC.7